MLEEDFGVMTNEIEALTFLDLQIETFAYLSYLKGIGYEHCRLNKRHEKNSKIKV